MVWLERRRAEVFRSGSAVLWRACGLLAGSDGGRQDSVQLAEARRARRPVQHSCTLRRSALISSSAGLPDHVVEGVQGGRAVGRRRPCVWRQQRCELLC